MSLLFPAALAGESPGEMGMPDCSPERCVWQWYWHQVTMVHLGSAPMVLEQIEPCARSGRSGRTSFLLY